jgi:uncharacterized protein YjbI with pentapeptide repeats
LELLNKTPFLFAPIAGKLNFPKHSLTLILKGTFDLIPDGKVKAAEEPLFPTGDEFYLDDEEMLGGPRYESDFAYHKLRADLLLAGKCYNPDGKYLPASQVTFQVGSKSKRQAVFGNRSWKRNALGIGTMTEPEPFKEMELRYDNSFGGEGFKKNPCGKGYNKEEDESGKKVKKLPNIEDPNNLVTSPGSKPNPTGFGPLNRMWNYRHKKMGTYKGDYLKKRWPWFSEDFDYSHFNAAPPDMQVEGYLRGDEKLYFENLHPEHSKYHSQLPGLRVRCFTTKKIRPNSEETSFDEVSLNLDTLWVDMEAEKLVLVWRGWTEVLSEEYEEIQHIFLMSEELKENPQNKEQCHVLFIKALEEYEAEWTETPEEEAPKPEEKAELPKVEPPKVELPVETTAAPKMSKAELTKHIGTQTAALMAQMGIPMENLPPEVRQQIEEQQQKLIDKITEEDSSKLMAMEQEENEAKLREELDKIGVDYDNLPPLSDSAKSEQKKLLQEMGIKPGEMEEDEAITKSWQLMAAVFPKIGIDPENLDSLIEQARPQINKIKEQLGLGEETEGEEDSQEPGTKSQEPDVGDTEGERKEESENEQDLSPEKLKARMESGESLAGLDLSGMDFSGQEFKEVDFSGAILAGAIFSGANLEGAVLEKADLKKADLSEANLAAANLADADLSEANLEKVNLEGADVTESTLVGANLKEAQLSDAVFEKAVLTEAILDQVIATGAMFPEADLSGASCKEANFSSADLSKCMLNKTNFENCNLSEASVEGAQGKNVNFIKADLTKFRASEQCDFTQGNFSKITGLESMWQKANLNGANFSYANMEGADFTKASLEKAHLSGSNMKFSRFCKANLKGTKMKLMNLFQGSLEKADLTGADLTGSNMYAAEFLEATIDGTIFQGTNLKMTKLANNEK